MISIDDPNNSDAHTNDDQSLVGPSARLTREFSLADIPSIPDDDVHDLESSVAVPPIPPPPSSRRRPSIEGGAAGGHVATRQPLVTHPKRRAPTPPPLPSVIAPAAPTARPAHYLGVTVPDRQHQAALDAVEMPIEAPEPATAAEGGALARLRAHGRPLVALGAVALAAVTFATGVAIFRTRSPADTAAEPLPTFLDLPSGAQLARPQGAAKAPGGDPPSAAPLTPSANMAEGPPGPAGAGAPAAPPEEPPQPVVVEPAVSVAEPGAAALSEPLAAPPSAPAPELAAAPAPTAPTLAPAAAPEATTAAEPSSPVAPPEGLRPPATVTRAAALSEAQPELPAADTLRPKPAATVPVVAAASPTSTASPSPRAAPPADAIVRRRTTYTYADSETFAVATAPKRVTDVILEAGEKIVARPTPGDAALWVIDVVDSVRGDEPQQHVYIRPLRAATSTNLNITTNRRNYHLELESSAPATYMAAVDWRYPASDAARRRRQTERESYEHRTTTRIQDVKALNFEYSVTVASGEPAWKPTMAFDDGVRTFIRFPTRVVPERAPLLLVQRSGSSSGARYVNHRITNDLYVIDRIIDAAELRLPDADGDQVVRITRRAQ